MPKEREKNFWDRIERVLLNYYNNDIFSAASVSVYEPSIRHFKNKGIGIGFLGEKLAEPVCDDSLFDLASLTKPLVTLPSILHLIDKGIINWDEPLSSLLEKRIPEPLKTIDLQSLLEHSSGLAAHHDYWQRLLSVGDEKRKEWLLDQLLAEVPEYKKGSRHLYSDLGYMLLGFIIEVKSAKSPAAYWYKNITKPLKLTEKIFFPDSRQRSKLLFAPTGPCRWSGEPLVGLVHDDNCRAIGGICGHAGLFGSSRGVLELCLQYLLAYHGRKRCLPINSETFRHACLRVGDAEWTPGFNLVSARESSSGSHFSTGSIGHLGFTGVSFWIDLQKELIVVLLTNRVLKGEDRTGISRLRPELHNTVVEYLRK